MNMKNRMKKASITIAMMVFGLNAYSASAGENPMDFVGIQHNMYLSCLHEGGDDFSDGLVRVVEVCGFDPGMPLDEFVKWYQPIVDTNPATPLAERMLPYRAYFSKYEFSFFERIDSAARTSRDLDEVASRFAALEAEGIARLDPRTKNGQKILSGLSVARNSLRYWTKYAAQQEGGITARRRWWEWAIIAVADVGGAIATAPSGPGAIGGAAVASGAAAGVMDVIDP